MIDLLRRFARDDRGGTMIEYALIASGLAITTIAAVQTIGAETNDNIESIAASFPSP